MPEFITLPFSVGDRFKDNAWHELRTAIINRQQLVDAIYGTILYPAQNPIQVKVKDLPGLIDNYRSKIDELAEYFYEEPDLASNVITPYTSTTLHIESFGFEDWERTSPSPSPSVSSSPFDLTPVTIPHKQLWNDMKLCLDLLKWINVDSDYLAYFSGHAWNGTSQSNSSWNVARAGWFNSLADLSNFPTTYTIRLGKKARARKYLGEYKVEFTGGGYDGQSLNCDFSINDLTSLINQPLIENGILHLRTSGSAGYKYITNLPFDIYIEGTKVNSSTFNLDPDFDVNQYKSFSLDNISDAILNVDGTANDLELRFIGTMTDDIGAIEWPAPLGSSYEGWSQHITATGRAILLKFSWDEIPSASPSATPSISPSTS